MRSAAARKRRFMRLRTTAPPIFFVAVKPTLIVGSSSPRSRRCSENAGAPVRAPFAARKKSARFFKRGKGLPAVKDVSGGRRGEFIAPMGQAGAGAVALKRAAFKRTDACGLLSGARRELSVRLWSLYAPENRGDVCEPARSADRCVSWARCSLNGRRPIRRKRGVTPWDPPCQYFVAKIAGKARADAKRPSHNPQRNLQRPVFPPRSGGGNAIIRAIYRQGESTSLICDRADIDCDAPSRPFQLT